jgi:hypothetical protein
MTKLISFKTFLQTGVLGPIRTGLTPREVAALMGTPMSWIDNGTLPFPNYWCFGKLEINFAPADTKHKHSGLPVAAVDWFQIEAASSLRGDCEIFNTGGGIATIYSEGVYSYSNGFGPALIVTLDGLHGASTPADFLAALAGCPDVEIHVARTLETTCYGVHIRNGQIDIIFYTHDDEEDEAVLLARTDAEVAAAVASARLDSIYSYSEPESFHAPNSRRERRRFRPDAFLAAT